MLDHIVDESRRHSGKKLKGEKNRQNRRVYLAVVLASCLSVQPGPAEELTLERETIDYTIEADAQLLPTKVQPVLLEPQAWSEFEIMEVLKHGAEVQEGDVLIRFKRDDYLAQLDEEKAELARLELQIRQLETERKLLEQESEHEQKHLQQEAQRARQDLKYLEKTGLQLDQEREEHRVAEWKFRVNTEEEELNQLKKMYQADDLTEETEEFILERQEQALALARQQLKLSQAELKHLEETGLQRKVEDLQHRIATRQQALERAEKLAPLTLESHEWKQEEAQRKLTIQQKKLEELKSDQPWFELTAQQAGRLYYGEFSDGQWHAEKAHKWLKKGSQVPTHTVFMTIVHEDSKLQTWAPLRPGHLALIPPGANAQFTLQDQKSGPLTLAVDEIQSFPNQNNNFLMQCQPIADDQEGLQLIAGMKGQLTLEVTRAEQILTVPPKYLKIDRRDKEAALVQVKLSDGKLEQRQVKIGPKWGSRIEISAGLEEGQVILSWNKTTKPRKKSTKAQVEAPGKKTPPAPPSAESKTPSQETEAPPKKTQESTEPNPTAEPPPKAEKSNSDRQ